MIENIVWRMLGLGLLVTLLLFKFVAKYNPKAEEVFHRICNMITWMFIIILVIKISEFILNLFL